MAKELSKNLSALSIRSILPNENTDRLIIGLDFGTTYSGVAYAFTTRPDQVYSVTEWPGAVGRTVPKAPTILKYDTDERKVPKHYLETLAKQFVISVPAVWSDKAKDTTLRAARHAGIGPIQLIKEPEAAAMSTLHDLKDHGLSIGDAITICDAGGGTVDLVSYEILKLRPLELKELVPPTGGIAGSMIINKRFEQWIKDTVGERSFQDLKITNGYRLAMKQFDEVIKPGFRSKEDDDQYITFTMAKIKHKPLKYIKASTLTLTGEAMHGIFEPVFKDIDKLIARQVAQVRIKRLQEGHPKGAEIKAIFLVGGFGANAYLRDAVVAAHKDIQVIQPNDAWSAIVRGAVLSKLPQEALVVSSVAERHYGVSAGAEWDYYRDKGRENEKFWDKYEEVYRIRTLAWYIHKHDDLKRSRHIKFPFHNTFSLDPQLKEYKQMYMLQMCASDTAPVHSTKEIKTCCLLKIDLSVVDKDMVQKVQRASDGRWYLRIDFNLIVKIEGARMVFTFECGGKEYGAVEAEY
ncbi:hypothetical protein NA57DRAFT_53054 [Rhizodiscina lignyota]|uniref:Actin-like ATPase domain-containing protein n=1 Tax=Rhizodiscina lignyota TaxID=1504668 RepID=A0A9P4IPY3_9PEZI|nr:hypothetical protein NA57DRAFT_53054 [Rhizodiscina lignyota]